MLSALGAIGGLLLSQAIAPQLLRMASTGDSLIHLDLDLDWRVLLFTASVAVATTLICSLLPSLRASKSQLMSTLREGGRGMTSSRGRLTAGRLFVGAQVALSLILLVAAGLFLRTLINLQKVNLGYERDHLAMLNVDASAAAYKDEARSLLFRNIQDKLQGVPGVKSATYSMNGLFSGSESGDSVLVEGYTPAGKDDKDSAFDSVGSAYFSAVGIGMLQGREIQVRDTPNSTLVCGINEAFAKQFFAGRNPNRQTYHRSDGGQKNRFRSRRSSQELARPFAARQDRPARVRVVFSGKSWRGYFVGQL